MHLTLCSCTLEASTIKLLEGEDAVCSRRSCKCRQFIFKNAKQTNRKKLLIIASCMWRILRHYSQLQTQQTASGLLRKTLLGDLLKIVITTTHPWECWFTLGLRICILSCPSLNSVILKGVGQLNLKPIQGPSVHLQPHWRWQHLNLPVLFLDWKLSKSFYTCMSVLFVYFSTGQRDLWT